MRHSLFESLEDGDATAVEKRFDFYMGGVAKNCQINNISHIKLRTRVWTSLDYDMLPISEIDET